MSVTLTIMRFDNALAHVGKGEAELAGVNAELGKLPQMSGGARNAMENF